MGEVFARYMEEKRYERDLKEDTYLQRVAYSKGFTQQSAEKATNKNKDEQGDQAASGRRG